MDTLFEKLGLAVIGLLSVQIAHAMCVNTTKNLVRLEVSACQQVKFDASRSAPPAHAIHKRGSSITGTLVTGRVVESTVVWDGNPDSAEYLFETDAVATDRSASFFLDARASTTCAELLGNAVTFVTDRPCCDVLPAEGLCLIPETVAIARVEKRPERWHRWETRN